jgi:hypothetical protein
MQENEFEEAVNHHMEGFGIEPSAQLWRDVERRIRKDKKRRFAIWYWFLLLLLAGAIITAVVFDQQENYSTGVATTQAEKNIGETKSSPDIINNASPVNDKSEHIESSERNTGKEENVGDEKNASSQTKGKAEKKNSLPGIFINQGNVQRKIMLPAMEDKVENSTAINTKTPGLESDFPKKSIEPQKKISSTSTANSIAVNDTIDIASIDRKDNSSDLKLTDSLKHTSTLPDSLTSLPEKKTAAIKINKWKRGVHIAAGRSGFSNGILSLNKSLRADALYNYSSGIGSGQSPNTSPSPVSASFYWSGGVFIQKSINKKLDIFIGADYNFLSTKNKIGSRVDSSRVVNSSSSNQVQVDHFYRPAGAGTSRSYTNQFHFIGLSADVAWKIVAAKRFRMYWENGISYNRLIGSNMLQYSSSLPGYYRDNNQLAKDQFVFKTGLLFPLSQNLSLKPFINYQLVPVFKKYQGTNAHFSIVGLQLKYFLKPSSNSATK